MQQLGNMKDNIDDLSDPEQFACLVSGHFNLLLKFKGISASNGSPKLVGFSRRSKTTRENDCCGLRMSATFSSRKRKTFNIFCEAATTVEQFGK